MKKTLVIFIVLFISIIFNIYLINKSKENKDNSIRWEDNYKATKDSIQLLQVTLKEFKELKDNKIDSLLKQIKIKPKQVDKIIYVENIIHIKDTIKVTLEKKDSTKYNYLFTERIDCIEINGFLESTCPVNLYVTSVNANVETNYVAYKEREKRKILGINTRLFGKKKTKLEVNSSCGDVKVYEIDIKKRK